VQFKRIKRPVDGVLLLDKPAGISSNQALQQVKRLYMAEKAGHTGSLDPFATGLLPICLGEATKFSHFLLEADKTYAATLQLGATSTTGDTEGEITPVSHAPVERSAMEATLRRFVGKISQVPPMYSALKHQGKALYEYARAGVEIARQAREVIIHDIALTGWDGVQAGIRVSCSKGTYIRTLAEDIGHALGCGAYLTQLRRLETGSFGLDEAFTLDMLEPMSIEQRDSCLLSPDTLVRNLPEVTLDEESAYYLCQGQPIWKSGRIPPGYLRVYSDSRHFLGLAELAEDGRIAPRRLLQTGRQIQKTD
jgi:tRNA pseudouridine55 synthase